MERQIVSSTFNDAYNKGLRVFRDGYSKLPVVKNRTGVETLTIVGASMAFRVSDLVLPVLNSRRINIKACKAEADWYFDGCSDVIALEKEGCNFYRKHHIVDLFGGKTVGRYIGWMLRSGPLGDQISKVISEMKANPSSRRLVLSLFNHEYMSDKDTLMPSCITEIIFNVGESETKLHVIFRSSDYLVGLPNDVLSIYFLAQKICRAAKVPDVNIMGLYFANVHIYKTQFLDAIRLIDLDYLDYTSIKLNEAEIERYNKEVPANYFDPVE